MKCFGKSGDVLRSSIIALQLYLTTEAVIVSSTSTPQNFKTFRIKTSPDGTPLCANDTASVVYNVSQLSEPPAGTECVPASVLCASKCKMNENCISFNWKTDEELCELFYYSPNSCGVVPMCNYYELPFLLDGCQRTLFSESTLVQQNVNGSAFFKKSWLQFKNGFGDPASDYWIGNEKLYQLTNILCNCSLHIDLYYNRSSVPSWYYADYSSFTINNETDGYRLMLGSYRLGNASDAIGGQNFKQFSTYDRDYSGSNCSSSFGVGWWYGTNSFNCVFKPCGGSNLNAEVPCFSWSSLGKLLSSKMYAVCNSKIP